MGDGFTPDMPDTDDIRDYYVNGYLYGWMDLTTERTEKFNRWLAEHDREVSERVHNETVVEMVSTWMAGEPLTIPENTYAKKKESS